MKTVLKYLVLATVLVSVSGILAGCGEEVIEETPAVKEGGAPADRKTGGKMTTELGVNE